MTRTNPVTMIAFSISATTTDCSPAWGRPQVVPRLSYKHMLIIMHASILGRVVNGIPSALAGDDDSFAARNAATLSRQGAPGGGRRGQRR